MLLSSHTYHLTMFICKLLLILCFSYFLFFVLDEVVLEVSPKLINDRDGGGGWVAASTLSQATRT